MITFEFCGTSHGDGYRGKICGLPDGVKINVAAVDEQLRLRKCGYGRSARQVNADHVEFVGAAGNDVVISGGNVEFFVPNAVINKEVRPDITAVRPGHADLVGQARYKELSARDVAEIASARSSVCYVVLGAICKQILDTYGIFTYSFVRKIGNVTARKTFVYGVDNMRDSFAELNCADEKANGKMKAAIDVARQNGNSLGGIVTVGATGVPMGLGEVFPYAKRLDSVIAANLVGIPSVKGISFGKGDKYSVLSGVDSADKLTVNDGKVVYATNNCGGIVGGITTGNDIICNLVVKAVPTVKGVQTIDTSTLCPCLQQYERADTCVVPQVGVIAQNILAYVLLDTILQQNFTE